MSANVPVFIWQTDAMYRFEVGANVRLVGGIADHYGQLKGTVTGVRQHVSGLAHLNKYRVQIYYASEEWFYEFQLAPALDCDESARAS
jgi:hypothetical protein